MTRIPLMKTARRVLLGGVLLMLSVATSGAQGWDRAPMPDRGCRLLDVRPNGQEVLSPWMSCERAWDLQRPGVIVLRQERAPSRASYGDGRDGRDPRDDWQPYEDPRRRDGGYDPRYDPRDRGPDGCITEGDGRCVPLGGRGGGGVPLGWSGWGPWGPPAWEPCLDRDRDSLCDEPWVRNGMAPQTMPDLRAVDGLRRGRGSFDVWRWLGRADLSPRLQRDANGQIRRVWWVDPAGTVVAIWTDRTGDQIVDDVEQLGPGGSWTRRMGPTGSRR